MISLGQRSVYIPPPGHSCYQLPPGDSCYQSPPGHSCYQLTPGRSCYQLPPGNSCYQLPPGHSCYQLPPGDSCYQLPPGHSCYQLPPGDSCYQLPPGHSCYRLPPGHLCYRLPPGDSCYQLPPGHSCYQSPPGHSCYQSPPGHSCYQLSPGHSCYQLPPGHSCYQSPPGHSCYQSPPGHSCYRLSSFLRFPDQAPVNPRQLASAGFLYTGYKDRVQCFSCGLYVENWVLGDDVRSPRWHRSDCAHAHGGDSGNVPIGGCWLARFLSSTTPQTAPSFSNTPITAGHPSRTQTTPTTRSNPLLQSSYQRQNWDPQDEPWTEHAKWCPTCEFLLQCKGPDFVHRLVSMFPNLPQPLLRGPFDVPPNQGGIRIQSAEYNSARAPTPPPEIIDPQIVKFATIASAYHEHFLKSIDLRKESERIRTFEHFPTDAPTVTTHDLARYGFFYLGNLDRVQCFSCGGVLRNWNYGDSVQSEHMRHYPTCNLVQNNEPRNVPLTSDERAAIPQQTPVFTEPPDPPQALVQPLDPPQDLAELGQETPIDHVMASGVESLVQNNEPRNVPLTSDERAAIPQQTPVFTEPPDPPQALVQPLDPPQDLAELGQETPIDHVMASGVESLVQNNEPRNVPLTSDERAAIPQQTPVFTEPPDPPQALVQPLDPPQDLAELGQETPIDHVMASGVERRIRHSAVTDEPTNDNQELTEDEDSDDHQSMPPLGQRSVYIPPGDSYHESYRLSTFVHFPDQVPVNPKLLASAGFLYTGYKDRVKCFSCGLCRENWELGDDNRSPRWHQSDCKHMHGGDSENVPIGGDGGTRVQLTTPEQGLLFALIDNVSHEHLLKSLHLKMESERLRTFEHFPTDAPTVTTHDLARSGFFYLGNSDRVQCFSCGGRLRNWNYGDSVQSEHRTHFPSCPMLENNEPRNVPLTSDERHAISQQTNDERAAISAFTEPPNPPQAEQEEPVDPTVNGTDERQRPHAGATEMNDDVKKQMDDDTESMQDCIRELQEERKCKVCLGRLADFVFVPCGHICCCESCSQSLKNCPLCRKKTEKAIRTYM